MVSTVLTLVRSIGGFVYTVFTALGTLSTQTIHTLVYQGFTQRFVNPFSEFAMTLTIAPNDPIFSVMDIIAQLMGGDPYTLSVLQFALISVASCIFVLMLVRFVKLFVND